jgi:hypothetical protein
MEPEAGIGVIVAQFSDEDSIIDEVALESICKNTIDNYLSMGTNSFNDSLSIAFRSETSTVSMTKPLEYFRWTIDSAITDSRNVMDAFVAGEN